MKCREVSWKIAVVRRLRSFYARSVKWLTKIRRGMWRTGERRVRRLRKNFSERWVRAGRAWRRLVRPSFGLRGERVAEKFLRRQGWTTLARGWRGRLGEIDLIMREGATIVFVEVKTRRSAEYLSGRYVRFGRRKRLAIYRTSLAFLRQSEFYRVKCRYDLVTILWPDGGEPVLRHFRHAFEPRQLLRSSRGMGSWRKK